MPRSCLAIQNTLRIEPASAARLEQFLAMIDTAHAAGESGDGYNLLSTAAIRRDPDEYLRKARDYEMGRDLPQGWVPVTTRWLIDAAEGDGGLVVGETRIRHALSPALEIEGGHVGYFIHPHFRGRGYGNAILALALRQLAELGIARVLVTCNSDNLRSRRVIERNGGAFDHYTLSPRSGKQVMRFWIENQGA